MTMKTILIILLLLVVVIGVWGFSKPPAPTRDPKPGYIYIIGNPDAFGKLRTWYKVGLSNNPERRRKTFNTAAPYDYKIYATIEVEDMYTVEKALHNELRKYRMRRNREWFDVKLDTILNVARRYCKKNCKVELAA